MTQKDIPNFFLPVTQLSEKLEEGLLSSLELIEFYDQFGNYDLVWWVGIGVGAFSAIIHLPVREKPMVMDVSSQLKTA